MLIEFSVSNFRSFRERQTLSMVAAPRLHKRENVFTPMVKGEKLPDLLKVAAVYGPNASGKSNLITAMGIFSCIAHGPESAMNAVEPFRFDKSLQNQASEFEWNFIVDGLRYRLHLAVLGKRITKEILHVFPAGKETLLYQRVYENGVDNYLLGSELEGGAIVHQAWKNLTGPNLLFIAQAVANASEQLQQLRKPFHWLGGVLPVAKLDWSLSFTIQQMRKDQRVGELLAEFLREVDVPILQIEFAQHAGLVAKDAEESLRFTHQTAMGQAKFTLLEESDGTRNLMGFWMFWMSLNHKTKTDLNVLAIDELDSSLHPNIIIALLKKRLELEHPAQMIFTTHDTHLMDAKILRRDQFWITERDANGATQLRSIHDFAGRESEDIEKRYYEGRYRGLPLLRRK